MADITLNSAVRSNLRTLTSTTELMNRTEKRLSTGKEVNSALDNPTNFFTAQSLERRAGDLSSLLDSVSNSVKTLEAADNGLSSISDVVESLKATARQAMQSPSAVKTQSSQGTISATGTVAADDLTNGGANALDGKTITVQNERLGETTTTTITIDDSGINTLEKLNEKLGEHGLAARIDGGELVVETANAYATQDIVATGTTASSDEVILGGTAVTGSITAMALGGEGKTKRANFADDFNDLLSQIDKFAKDSSYNGVNLLNGDDLEVVFNEDASSKLDVKGVEFSFAGLGLDDIAAGDLNDSSKANAVIAKLEKALTTIESQSSKFGSQLQIVETREKFTKSMVGTLEDGAFQLTASDTNTEAANLASLQTRQSLIVSALSISNQQEGAILQLLR